MKLLYTLSLLALGSIAAAEDKTNATSQNTTEATQATPQSSSEDGASKGLANCHIPELKKGHVLRASCFADVVKQELVHSELDLNHCFGASLLKGELTAEPDGHFSRKCVKSEIQLEPTVWMNNQGLLECHGHVGKPINL